MDPTWANQLEDGFETNMREIETKMSDMEYGCRKYLKRKACGALDYIYVLKRQNGEIDVLTKSGYPTTNPPVAFNPPNPPPPDDDNNDDGDNGDSGLFEDRGEETNEEEDVNKEEEDDEDEDEDKEANNGGLSPLLLTQGAKAEPPLVTPKKDKFCPHCGNANCHATKYGRFLAYLSHSQYNGDFRNKKHDLRALFFEAYITLKEWEKRVGSSKGAGPIDASEITFENVPECMKAFCSNWLKGLKKRHDDKLDAFCFTPECLRE